MPVTLVDMDEEKITLDANHELAGQDLIFDIELVSIG
jgi:peptidylprolyl isomerase